MWVLIVIKSDHIKQDRKSIDILDHIHALAELIVAFANNKSVTQDFCRSLGKLFSMQEFDWHKENDEKNVIIITNKKLTFFVIKLFVITS